MSPMYNSSTSPAVDPQQRSQEYVDDLGLFHPAQLESTLLSPYTLSQTYSGSASPSYNINSTPGETLSEYSNYQPSELSEIEDPFFGVDFDAGVQRVDSVPLTFANTSNIYQLEEPHRPAPIPPIQDESASISEPRSASTYPLSPIHSSFHNTPSPGIPSNVLKFQPAISQHEFTGDLHNLVYQPVDTHPPNETSAVQLTPDNSGSSRTSSEEYEAMNMNRPEQSPRISISQWESMHPQENSDYFAQTGRHIQTSNVDNSGSPVDQHIDRDEDGAWRSNEATGHGGLGPETRGLSGMEVPSLKQQEEQRRVDSANLDIQEWRSQAGSDVESESFFPTSEHIWDVEHSNRASLSDDDNDIAPVDDSASIRENRLKDGQIYYNFKNAVPNEVDYQLMNQSRHWSDAPVNPYITRTQMQPLSSNEAIKRWNANADTFSLSSRAATWGTRRRSEPSIADWDSVADGSFLKRLSISKSKEGGRPRNNSIFDQGLDRLANFAKKRSDSRLKRARSAVNIPEESFNSDPRKNSQDTLAPPGYVSNFGQKPSNINTTLAAMAGTIAAVGTTHARSGSVSGATTSPKSPLHIGGLARSVIKRARSRSELTTQEKAAPAGLAELWRKKGGPPVPALSPANPELEVKKPEVKQPEVVQGLQDNDDDEDDEDDFGDESDLKINTEEEADPIEPNYEGFKAHVKRLNPDMDPHYKWLVSRIAHQQEIRYKSLLELRVKHSRAVTFRNCAAAHHCIAQGGTATLLDAKGNLRDSEPNTSGLQLVTDFSDDSNPGEGALTAETFPQGVPRPPAKSLPAEFECQLCFKAKKFQKPSDWTKHVHEDIQPFTCTYDKCKEPKSFKRKADWVRHENERHRHLEWWVCQVDDCRHPCYRKDNFLQHLVREHKLPEPKQKTKAAIKKARSNEPAWRMLEQCHHETISRPQEEPCKFCGKTFVTWKKLTVHLAKHMEHISLPVLRLVEARMVDADTIISPVEQNLTPVTPIGRTKLENSPYNLNNMTPYDPNGLMGMNYPASGFDQRVYYQTADSTSPYMQNQMPQQNGYNQNMYSNNFGMQAMEAPRGFPVVSPNRHNDMTQNRNFVSMDPNFAPVKLEQRGFGSLDSAFSNVMPAQNYHPVSQPGYSMPQNYSSAPAVSGYQTSISNVHGDINNGGFEYNPTPANAGPGFQQTPMDRAPGSGSSYGHSPQDMPPQYYGHQ